MSPTGPSITTKVVKGAGLNAAARFGTQILSMACTTVVARRVPPRAYGLMGMAAVVIGFVGLFRDIGTTSAIVQRRDIDDGLLTSVFWLNTSMGLAVAASCWLAAPWVALFYRESALVGILRALSTLFVISSLSGVHAALLTRELRFGRIAAVELIAGGAGLTTAVTAALLGAGVWSLVLNLLGIAVFSVMVTIWARPWRPKLHFSSAEIRSISGFGLNLSAYNIVNYFARNADNLLIGKYLGAIPLGHYALGYNIMLFPVQAVSQTLGRVLFPAFVTMQSDHTRFRQAYLRASAATAFFTFPLMAGAAVLAPELIALFLGPHWWPVAPVVRILAPVGMLQSLTAITAHIYMATGSTRAMFRWNTLFSAVLVTGFVAGLSRGIIGVAAIYAVLSFLLMIPTLAIPFRLIGLRLTALWKSVRLIVAGTAAMAAVVAALRWLLLYRLNMAAAAILGVCVVMGATFYFLFMIYRRSAVFLDVLTLASPRSRLLRRLAELLQAADSVSA
jgi:O-antigen/teichoic acid export membrane protein